MAIKRRMGVFLFLLVALLALFIPMAKRVEADVHLSTNNVTLLKYEKYDLKVLDTSKKVRWTSSNPKVVSVSAKGRIRGRRSGRAVVSAKVDGKKLACTVKVKTTPIVSVTGTDPTVYPAFTIRNNSNSTLTMGDYIIFTYYDPTNYGNYGGTADIKANQKIVDAKSKKHYGLNQYSEYENEYESGWIGGVDLVSFNFKIKGIKYTYEWFEDDDYDLTVTIK